MKNIYTILVAILLAQSTLAQRIKTDQVAAHISYLSSDRLQGRGTSSEGERLAAAYITSQFKAMGLSPKGSKGYYYDFTFRHSKKVHDTTHADGEIRKGRNVLAYLDNNAEYTIVIGAHFDHLGLGHDDNSLDANPHGRIHNGADDNASGVAGVLELARYFAHNGIREKYNFLFMTFSGEELGLLGSKKWCENPSYPLERINYMVNMDMIGRLNDSTHKLLVHGVGTSAEWIPALEKINTHFVMKYDSAGIGPSDQTSFYLKNIPVVHFFTGQHSDYHKPTDDFDKINLKGEADILELIIDMIFELEQKPKLNFLKTKEPESKRMSFGVTLGLMPDYTFDGKGMRLDGVSDGKPASKAGLLGGDIITALGSHTIQSVQDYMKALAQFKKGERTIIEFIRANSKMALEVEF